MNALIERHYYSEDFELISSLRAFQASLVDAEKDHLKQIVAERIRKDESLVDVMLCAVVDVPDCVDALAAQLSKQDATSQLSRALIESLSQYSGDAAFRAVERFLDSDQEREALMALARIDFARATSRLLRVIEKDQWLDLGLHILYERKKKVGLEQFTRELCGIVAVHGAYCRRRLLLCLDVKQDDYNPFSSEERRHLGEAICRP